MQQEATLVFPHHLFEHNPAAGEGRVHYVIEESLFFNQFPFHKQKLIFHRATMKEYARFLMKKGYTVKYIQAVQPECDIRTLITALAAEGVHTLHFCEVTDNWLNKRIIASAKKYKLNLRTYATPLFLSSSEELTDYYRNSKRLFQTDFYIHQRKTKNILITEAGKPEGGKWSFDAENRERYPRAAVPPRVKFPAGGECLTEAIAYCSENFPASYGELPADTFYPVTFKDAQQFLDAFIEERLEHFGIYEDALVAGEHFLHHSVLTPSLNCGLLTPAQITESVLEAYNRKPELPLNSVEGFIRQVVGWREFIRYVYVFRGTRQRTTNYFNFTRSLPESMWNGTTGIYPVDNVIKKLLATGYSHHIERLMVLGNFMLLCEFNPDEVYRWFMTMYIDSYDWVMVPNVYGMSQFADGGLMATKPYISGSNYLMKMGDYPKGDWQKIWDALFWRFIHTYRSLFLANPRMAMMVRTFDKMDSVKKDDLLLTAERYLATLQ